MLVESDKEAHSDVEDPTPDSEKTDNEVPASAKENADAEISTRRSRNQTGIGIPVRILNGPLSFSLSLPMTEHRDSLKPEILAKLSGLALKARLIVEGFVTGLHRSPYQGFSVEFAEHREYVPGDDLRYVDWKAYGKSDRYYLKRFEEDTNFSCLLVLDTSESMQYRSSAATMSKLEYAKMAAAALAHLVVRQQDAVGLATFDSELRRFVRPSSQPAHLRNLVSLLEEAQPGGETAIGPLMHLLAERLRKRGLVIVFSDLFDDVDSLTMGLKHFRHRRHDVTLMQVIDPAEQDFDFDEPTLFKGLEGLPDHMTDPRTLKTAYRAEFEEFLWQVRGVCRTLAIDHVLLRTDQPLDVPLRSYLTHRMQRAGRS